MVPATVSMTLSWLQGAAGIRAALLCLHNKNNNKKIRKASFIEFSAGCVLNITLARFYPCFQKEERRTLKLLEKADLQKHLIKVATIMHYITDALFISFHNLIFFNKSFYFDCFPSSL